MLGGIGKDIKTIVKTTIIKTEFEKIKDIFEKIKSDFEKIKEQSLDNKDKK